MMQMTDTNMNQQDLQTQLWDAAAKGDCRKVRYLVMNGADIEATDPEGRTAFNIATQYGRSEVAMTLLASRQLNYMMSLGADPSELQEKPAESLQSRDKGENVA